MKKQLSEYQKKPIFNAVAEARVCVCGNVVDAEDVCVWCEIRKSLQAARESGHPVYATRVECKSTVSISSGDEDE